MLRMNFPRRKALRREEAEERQERYNLLSLSEKILQQEPFGGKQLARLKKQQEALLAKPAKKDKKK